MSPDLLAAFGWGLATSAAAFAVLLAWRSLRRARRMALHRAQLAREHQPEHRARLAARLGCREDELPELGGWKITPDFACVLADLIDERAPHRVLELGSGTSTLLLAMLLKGTEARLSSLEQDAAHVEATRTLLEQRGLSGGVDLVHAPLEGVLSDHRGEPPWYAQSALNALASRAGGPWDIVIVDGPSTLARADARLPALPRLSGRLAPGAIVVLDDAGRAGERAVVAAWRGMGLLGDFTIQELPLARGAVVLRRQG